MWQEGKDIAFRVLGLNWLRFYKAYGEFKSFESPKDTVSDILVTCKQTLLLKGRNAKPT